LGNSRLPLVTFVLEVLYRPRLVFLGLSSIPLPSLASQGTYSIFTAQLSRVRAFPGGRTRTQRRNWRWLLSRAQGSPHGQDTSWGIAKTLKCHRAAMRGSGLHLWARAMLNEGQYCISISRVTAMLRVRSANLSISYYPSSTSGVKHALSDN